jgi:hypothetical protein
MGSSLIFLLMVLHVGEGAQYCFDDTAGHIAVKVSDNSDFGLRSWRLTWFDFNWLPTQWTGAGITDTSTGTGCCTGGTFNVRAQGQRTVSLRFEFVQERHIVCGGSRIATCTFPASVQEEVIGEKQYIYIAGRLDCTCIGRKDDEVNVTYSTPIKDRFELKYENIFD